MERSEFEEKTYECMLYEELTITKGKFTPGQVLENSLGFDCAMLVNNNKFWKMLGYRSNLRGVVLSDFKVGKFGVSKNSIPTKFKYNLFIQAKRPDYLIGPNKKIIKYGIKQDYYRFYINQNQQQILEKLSKFLGQGKALVVYASPCFHTYNELYNYTIKSEIIDNSNFIKPYKLNGHEQWTYEYPGSKGVACSEPTVINHDDIREIINYEDYINSGFETRENFKEVYLIVKELIYTFQNKQKHRIKKIEKIEKYIDEAFHYNNEFIKYYLVSQYFFSLNNIRWALL